MKKYCKFCDNGKGLEKDLEDFPRNRAMKDGRDNRCKDCWKIYSAAKRARKLAGGPVTTFSKQEPIKSERTSRASILNEDLSKLTDKVEIVTLSYLNKIPGDRKFFEWVGLLKDGLVRYKELYGIQATIVYTYTGNFARHFIG